MPLNHKNLVLSAAILGIFALNLSSAHDRYPPGVPRPKEPAPPPGGDGLGDSGGDIKFHEPQDFQSQDQQQQQQPNNAQPKPTGKVKSGHKHGFGGGKGNKMNIKHEKEHMKEHVAQDEGFIDLDSMTEPQLMAQYFRSFDLDKNSKIDGLEMLKAMLKMDSEHDDHIVSEDDIDDMSDEIDDELSFYDENGDGVITYPEFMRNHKKRIAEINEE